MGHFLGRPETTLLGIKRLSCKRKFLQMTSMILSPFQKKPLISAMEKLKSGKDRKNGHPCMGHLLC